MTLFEDVLHQLQQQLPRRELSRPYTGVLEAQVTEKREFDLTEWVILPHVILTFRWGNVGVTYSS